MKSKLTYMTLILCLMWMPVFVLAQNNTISAPVKQTHHTDKPPRKQTNTSPIEISLACRIDGQLAFFTQNQWKSIPDKEKVNMERIGLCIKSRSENFIIDLYNNLDRKVCSTKVPFQVAQNKTGGQLPSSQQWNLIKSNRNKVREALVAFGGDHLCSSYFWSKDGTLVNMTEDGVSSSGKAEGMYRICTSDLEKGFSDVVYQISTNDRYDIICTSDNKEYSVVRFRDKWGIIRSDGSTAIPFRYDNFECGNNAFKSEHHAFFPEYLEKTGLISAQRNNKWGYINIGGEEVIPCVFDEVQGRVYSYDSVAWVKRNNYYGTINRKGEFVYPLEFESPIRHYNHQPAKVKKNGKWGFLNENGTMLTPFVYDSTRGFGWKENLAPVSQDGKYGYIGKSGDIIIPLQYSFADNFGSGLGAVVKDKKVGFIDENGKIAIPFIYEIAMDFDRNGSYLEWYDFSYGNVAAVKKNGKWGIINKKGENKTEFKYDRISSANSEGEFTAKLNDRDVFLDKGGNEYSSEKERREKSDSILAVQGYPYEQFKMGRHLYNTKKYTDAYPWIKKSAEGGDDEGQCHLGYYYYYGHEPIMKSYPTAFKWFNLSAEQGNDDACYFLGWMYEYGQGVIGNKMKAIEWYKKSNGSRDAKKRIEVLKKK